MKTARVELPDKLIPVFEGPADVRGAHGGRGSAKTRSFAKMTAVYGYRYGMQGVRGQILCARHHLNSLEDSSLEECKRAIEEEPWLSDYYEIGETYIRSRDGNIWYTFAGLNSNLGSIKSKGRILVCWVDEAEPVTETAFTTLGPTLREEGEDWNAELWLTWNRRRRTAAVERYAHSRDPLIKIVELNWRDNPKFPDRLERERQRDLAERPEQYAHIWEGDYEEFREGAYYTKQLLEAKEQRRIGRLAPDPLMKKRLFCDIGGTGRNADAFAIWVAQFVGMEIRALDYYESVGQPLATHVEWMRANGYEPKDAQIWLPHDGANNDKVFSVSHESALRSIGYDVTVIPNQGKGAALQRIEAARRVFPRVWFDEQKTQAGREALAEYHEKRDEARRIGLGPEHNWASHGADAFGLMAVVASNYTGETWGAALNYPTLGLK
ncbi:terminase [beta proteobacterium AAP99]|nr:terminase [beta proteobacterium AAP99]